MKTVLALLTAFTFIGAPAKEPFYQTPHVRIWLTNQPCPSKARVDYFAQYTPDAPHYAVVVAEGKQVMACWVLVKDADSGAPMVFLSDDNGKVGGIPLDRFKMDYRHDT